MSKRETLKVELEIDARIDLINEHQLIHNVFEAFVMAINRGDLEVTEFGAELETRETADGRETIVVPYHNIQTVKIKEK